ncbi:MAG TPA: L-aspartate oxidase [Chloroflexia bacterium]|nr:L-aspartate oxidase [Chloroflexia bacterium]
MTDQYDYIIIGSGIAGLSVALAAAQGGQRSLIITKSHLEESNTRYAQGGIAAAVAESDTTRSHEADTLVAGAGLCDKEAVSVLTGDAPARIAELIKLGVPFDREENGELELGREGAHSANRILHAGGDATGRYIEQTMAEAVRQSPLIERLEEHFATALLKDENGRVYGARLLAESAAEHEFEVYGRFVVLATGGAGQLYKYNTNPQVTTGDGIVLAWEAGAALADLEFYQFHPTALNLPGVPTFLISEAVRGDGAILRNANGDAFMYRYDPRLELASRDIVARAIASEMALTGQPVYLDATHLGEATLRHRFPSIYRYCEENGLDIAKQPIPVSPAAHYFMGGILTGQWGETTLPGLFACGEAACTGVHGANRLASNSLLEGLVFGQRIYDYTATGAVQPLQEYSNSGGFTLPALALSVESPEALTVAELPSLPALQALMWERAGLTRDREGMLEGLRQLEAWETALEGRVITTRAERELANLVTLGRLVMLAALTREESRGAHYRSDFPKARQEWQRRIVLTKANVSSQAEIHSALAGVRS